jgi:tol-pal system protein YbgF
MAKTKEKLAFGIFQDGLIIKVAQLACEKGIVKVQSLEETILSSPLFLKETVEAGKTVPTIEEEISIPEVTELDEETFDMPEISEFEQPDEIESTEKDEVLPGLKDLQNFMQQFPLERGKISSSANDEQISYFQFDPSFNTGKLVKKLQNELLTKEEIKAKNYSMDYILNLDKSGLAFVHRGKFTLFHALRDINLVLSKEKYFYSNIDTNEVSLINIVRHNYDFSPDEYVLIIYIGVDYKVGIILKNKNHIKTFPIIVQDTDPDNLRQAIYSKVIMEQDISDIPITKNIILAGDYATDEDIEFFKSNATEGDSITKLDLKHLYVQEGLEEVITPDKIARFAIPIALAWKTLQTKNKDFSPCNLLPSKVIENQKYFKIVWHGFIVLAAIFYFAFSGTIKNLEMQQEIKEYTNMNYRIERELTQNRVLIKRLNEIKKKVSDLEANFLKVEKITDKKNQWNYILHAFTRSLQRNQLSWITNLTSKNGGFQVYGYTTSRRSILEFSRLFPEGEISSVLKYDLEDVTVWKFDLTFSYPDPEELKKAKEKTTKEITSEEEAQAITTEVEDEKSAIEEKIEEVPPAVIAQEYSDIVQIYFAGDINSALNKFTEFVQKYPKNDLAYNANYFVGECLYLLNRTQEAKRVLEEVYKMKGNKTPDALIMLGNCSEKEKDFKSAKAYWNQLIKEFPKNSLAKAAKYKIQKLEGK